MKHFAWVLAPIVGVIASAWACSSDPDPAQPTGGAGGVGGSGNPTSGGNGGTGGVSACGAGCDVDCDPTLATPSEGICGEGFACNPVTNEGCNGPAGQSCDYAPGGFQCYSGHNTAEVCQACSLTGPTCVNGFTCIPLEDGEVYGVCAKFCCSDQDCGSGGVCTAPGAMFGVGYCQASGTGPGSGGGGSGNNGGTGGIGNNGGMGGIGNNGGMGGLGGVGGVGGVGGIGGAGGT
jgi:hypothetical protein